SSNRSTEHVLGDVRESQAARHNNKNLLHRQRRGCHGQTERAAGRTRFDDNAKDEFQVSNVQGSGATQALENATTFLNVMLSAALRRNAKHEPGFQTSLIVVLTLHRNYPRSFGSLRMTMRRGYWRL